MDCPKCNGAMQEHTTTTLQGAVTIDRCADCGGMWFDNGEAEKLKGDWMSDFWTAEIAQSVKHKTSIQRSIARAVKSKWILLRILISNTSLTKPARSMACSWMQASSLITRMKP